MIAVILFSYNNLNWALTVTAVVVREFLRATNIHITQFERVAGAHLFEWVFLVDPDFVEHPTQLLSFSRVVLCEIERLKG
jgi:hypothetical protein